MRALLVVSPQGNGHLVRCRALAAELTLRGYACTMTNKPPLSAASVDFSVVDGKEYGDDVVAALSDRPLVRIVDEPGAYDANVVVFGNAGAKSGDACSAWHMGVSVSGPGYALLRPEFAQRRKERPLWMDRGKDDGSVLDLRLVVDQSADDLALALLRSRVNYAPVITYGGMRALEAACVRGNARGLVIEARNAGEEMNKRGLEHDRGLDLVDGEGVGRVVEVIEGVL